MLSYWKTMRKLSVTNQGVYSFTVILLDPSSFHTQKIWSYKSLFKGDQLHMIQLPKHSEQLHSQISTVAVAILFQFSSLNVAAVGTYGAMICSHSYSFAAVMLLSSYCAVLLAAARYYGCYCCNNILIWLLFYFYCGYCQSGCYYCFVNLAIVMAANSCGSSTAECFVSSRLRKEQLMLASQLVTQVEYEKQQEISAQNGKQKAAEHIVAQVGNGNLMAECVQPLQVSIPNSIEHSNGEELSDSEDELLEVLEGVVSSKQEVEAPSQSIVAKSLIAPRSELEIFPTPEPPDHLAPGVTGEPVTLYSNGDTGFNKHLSKSTKRRLRKQAKEASSYALSRGTN
ncbi:hypothetical protein RHSIM_Rhsim07G0148700 [Rhododendron simsii]|uniref:Uncharacterized protein n=1 Tax=Rhododendron simsii TaxID=118357 RepID=A0A834LIU1_RHOSS|nr:hypothetical protein RHSIM_Rhsim07G0148700 [Rhododendron simsii]